MTRTKNILLLLLGLPGFGCVLPLEPSFSDPSPNHPPFLVQAKPALGSVVSVSNSATTMPLIELQLGDQDHSDVLYIRWLLDYPETTATEESTLLLETALPASNNEIRPPIRFSPNCVDHHLANQSMHRLSLVVADRPFSSSEGLPPEKRWTTTDEPGFILESTWTIAATCNH